jgi:hypothetical protein
VDDLGALGVVGDSEDVDEQGGRLHAVSRRGSGVLFGLDWGMKNRPSYASPWNLRMSLRPISLLAAETK